jgi:uncharacterized protein (TIGR03435 family)
MASMILRPIIATLLIAIPTLKAQSRPAFEVATIKPADSTPGRYMTMQSNNRFIAKAYSLNLLVAAAYNLNPHTISGGPGWVDSDHFDIVAVTPGDVRPTHDEQMAMLRTLLTDRFKLTFHREQKEFAIYALEVAKGGPKLKPSAAAADAPHVVGPGVLYPEHPVHIALPVRNATLDDFAELMQRGILDRPVVNHTGLTGRFDFDLAWAPDETQFGGDVPAASSAAPDPPLFTAIQQQAGLVLRATRGMVSALVVDTVERPTAN